MKRVLLWCSSRCISRTPRSYSALVSGSCVTYRGQPLPCWSSTSISTSTTLRSFSSASSSSVNNTKMDIAVDGKIDRFSLQAKDYAKFRPNYPEELFRTLLVFDNDADQPLGPDRKSTKTALDVATGTGFMARQLAEHYSQVIGIDRSQKQLHQALMGSPLYRNLSETDKDAFDRSYNKELRIGNITYKLGSAYETNVESQSVDVVTCAQAMHWFELDKFFQEVKRVLKPSGTFAVFGYAVLRLSPELQPFWDKLACRSSASLSINH
eukprot:TRINITY_DN2043_c0_g1_i2.p1 TRINITY_DN2043_c0_g1~~TRINITY_DN2043_c0_g1_i2.p1  ORF type:complete len:267 (-),score=31.80 TRINITY_DN2043_c0_g1_i2:31-831(-)